MNIGLDFTRLFPSFRGGVTSYAIGLLRGLARTADRHTVQLFVNPRNQADLERYCKPPRVEQVVVSSAWGWDRLRLGAASRSVYLGSRRLHQAVANALLGHRVRIMDGRSDVIYVPTTALTPYDYTTPTIVSMHDIQHVHYPQFFSRRQLVERRITFDLIAEKATYLQASSEYIKEDLVAHFPGLNPDRIVVIPEGVMLEDFTAPAEQDILARYGLPAAFLFYPAQLWLHKNHITLLRALHRLAQEHGTVVPLVMTGRRHPGAEHLFSFIKTQGMKQVYHLGEVSFRELVALYQAARFCISASLHESSCLPFLEAAAAGCPVIASDIPPNREMTRVLQASLFDPLDDQALADLLARLWEDDATIHRHREHNRAQIGYYSWDNAARRYLAFIESRIDA